MASRPRDDDEISRREYDEDGSEDATESLRKSIQRKTGHYVTSVSPPRLVVEQSEPGGQEMEGQSWGE